MPSAADNRSITKVHINNKDYIVMAGGSTNNNASYLSDVYVLSFDGSSVSIVATATLPKKYAGMSGSTLNVNGVDYAIFSGGAEFNVGNSDVFYVINFDGINVHIVTQGKLSDSGVFMSSLKARINSNDSIVLVNGSVVNILTNKGVYNS